MASIGYYQWLAHFPAIDNAEADALIEELSLLPALDDIRKLSELSARQLGTEIESWTGTPFTEYWHRLTTRAADLTAAFTPVDPEAPTPAEQVLMDRLMPDFFAGFPTSKHPALQDSLNRIRTVETDPWSWLTAVSVTTEVTARAQHDLDFFVLLAGYYLTMAGDYIVAASRRYFFLGRVLDGTDGPPKDGVRVLCTDEFLDPHMRVLGMTVTDRNGYFRMPFDVLEGVATTYELKFTFTHAELASPVDEDLDYDSSDPRTPVEVELTFTPAAATSKTIVETGVTIPSDVQTYLTANSITITRLEDIRLLGGFRNIPDDSINKSNPDLLKLDALASLEILQDDLTKNATLHTRGYSGLSQIANASRREFVEVNTDIFGDFEAGRLHYQARATHLYALNKLAEAQTARADGELTDASATGCGCSDCSSAVSPLAYLADLLSFTTQRVTRPEDPPGDMDPVSMTLTVLNDTFFQNFSGLRADCEQLKETLCQNRIAAEVMRKYYESLPGAPNATQLAEEKLSYVQNAYELLLTKLGTSYLEVRKLRAVTDTDERERVSERLGIILDDPDDAADTLEQLFVDVSEESNLTEAMLETKFGVRKSDRSVLDDTPESKVSLWKKARLRELWVDQHALTDPFHARDEVIIDPDVVTVDDIRTPGEGNAWDIWVNRREWLDELFDSAPAPHTVPAIDHRIVGNVIVIEDEDPAVVEVGDTVQYVNTGAGYDETFTAVQVSVVDGNTEVVVDRDLELNMANGVVTVNGSTSYTNDNTRSYSAPELSVWLSKMLDTVTYNRIAAVGGSFNVSPWAEASVQDAIDNLMDAVGPVRSADATAIDDLMTDHQLLPAELFHVVDFITGYAGYPFLNINSENNYSDEEWDAFRSILIKAFKRKAHGVGGGTPTGWIDEEIDASVVLGPLDFHPSIKEPLVGPWPPIPSDTPLVDPDLIGVADIPELPTRERTPGPTLNALTLLGARRDALTTVSVGLRAAYSTGYLDMLNTAFNRSGTWDDDPSTGYFTILNDLTSPLTSEAATDLITETLKITVDDFKFVMDVGERKFAGTDVGPNEIDRLVMILGGAAKHTTLYALWKGDEDDAVATDPYWQLRKARLPKWRATPEQRKAWLAALAEHGARPMIDADLIGPGDMLNPVEDDAAFDLWEARRVEMHEASGWLDDIGSEALFSGSATLAEFDALTVEYLGHIEASLGVLQVQQEGGVDIRPRVAQLNLIMPEFAQLAACRDILVAVTPLTAEELTSIKHILAQVQKRRQFYAYRVQELAILPDPQAPLTLSQDYFKLADADFSPFPSPPEHVLLPWLADEVDLIEWRRTLRGRIEQEATVVRELEELVFAVDDAMVLHLRDAYVRASSNLLESPLKAARRLGDILLIDLENNCCYKTNRVAAAIETIQQLLWKTRTGDIQAHHPGYAYDGDDFDEAWTWIGSYANWRAAMFVFLYPENVLIPSLRKHQTPAFQDVIGSTRNNRRFGPQGACEVAHTYREYLKDVSNLKLACSVQANILDGQRECGRPQNAMKVVNFVFSTAQNSGKAYWTTVDSRDATTINQDRFWTEVPGVEKDAALKGGSYYRLDQEGVNHVYLFFMSPKKENESKFFAARFQVERGTWDDEILEFEVEDDDLRNVDYGTSYGFSPDFEMKIAAMAVLRNDREWDAPIVALSLWSHPRGRHYTFARQLNAKGTELAESGIHGTWITFMDNDVHGYDTPTFDGRVLDMWAVHNEPDDIWQRKLHFILLEVDGSGPGSKVVRFRLDSSGLEKATNVSKQINLSQVRGLLFDEPANQLYYFASSDPTPGALPDKVVSVSGILDPDIEAQADIESAITFDFQFDIPAGTITTLAPICSFRYDGTYAGGVLVMFYQQDTSPNIKVCTLSTDDGVLLWSNDVLRITPDIQSMPVIGPYTNAADQAARKGSGEAAWIANEEGNFRLIEYVQEGFYFVPMQIALQLHANGHYAAALDWFRTVYDFRAPSAARKIHYGLFREETGIASLERASDWYGDPLNPHGIASMRRHTYTRYTILSIAYCLLDQADAEFTTDNSETVPRARELYEDALNLLTLIAPDQECESDVIITGMLNDAELGTWESSFGNTLGSLDRLAEQPGFDDLVEDIEDALATSDPLQDRLAAIRGLIDAELSGLTRSDFEDVLTNHEALVNAATAAALGSAEADETILRLSVGSAGNFDRTMEAVTGRLVDVIDGEDFDWFTDREASSELLRDAEIDVMRPGRTGELVNYYVEAPARAFHLNSALPDIWLSGVPFSFCAVPNPIVSALLMRAEVNLFKIRNCMNIAGMVRELDPFAAPTDSTTGIPVIGVGGTLTIPIGQNVPPSAYRYRAIVDRAKQLVAMAQQVEGAFLSALEKFDAESYSQLRAEQDIDTTKAGIKLQDLKITEANDGVTLAELQKERATIQLSGLDGMISAGLNGYETELARLYEDIARFTVLSNWVGFAAQASQFAVQAAGASIGPGMAMGIAAAASGTIAALGQTLIQNDLAGFNLNVQLNTLWASFARRVQEWEYQQSIARQDEKIGEQGIKLAQDRLRVVGQEREIAVLQNDHAKATLDFLKNKFTSAELYEWMSKVLEDIYSWFLQEATSMALMAQRQLAFERQADLPPFVRSDYWVVDSGSAGGISVTGEGAVDRRGITGSSRLLKDLYELDQYAFNTNSPKLQMSKTISLQEIAPEELMRLRNDGVMSIYTTESMFDRDYPGHYLRLIKRVNVTVIALTPPTKGIRATLTNGGVSTVVTGGTIFQTRTINRYPEQIALSSGVNDHGVFQLQGEGEFLNPFEGHGVQTQWELRMEKAANHFDFGSIADVLLTIEYEALNSYSYRQKVVQQLNSEGARGALAISFKNNLPDQWFDLHNPLQVETPHQISFDVSARDLAPNVEDATITGVTLFVVMKGEGSFNSTTQLALASAEGGGADQAVSAVDGLISQGTLNQFIGLEPTGRWTFSIAADTPAIEAFAADTVEDVVLIVGYEGTSTPYGG